MTVRQRAFTGVLVASMLLFAALLFGGCSFSVGTNAGVSDCLKLCGTHGVAGYSPSRCDCNPPDAACSVDRLLVTPIPPGKKVK